MRRVRRGPLVVLAMASWVLAGCDEGRDLEQAPDYISQLADRMPKHAFQRSGVTNCAEFDSSTAKFTFVGSCTASIESSEWIPATATLLLEQGSMVHASYLPDEAKRVDIDMEPGDEDQGTARIPIRKGKGTLILSGTAPMGQACVVRLIDR